MLYQAVRQFFLTGNIKNLSRAIYTTRIVNGTHYDTLNLPRNCTTKDVRDSFIRLSKQLHPDRNRNDPNKHAQFIKLNEAYSILIRPEKRRVYDLTLRPQDSHTLRRSHGTSPYDIYTTAYRQRVHVNSRVWRDESFWEYKDKSTFNDYYQSGDYYGIKGVKRLPNRWIAYMCIAVAAVGIWLHVLLIRHVSSFNRESLDRRSQETSKVWSGIRSEALKNGSKLQLEIMKERLEAGDLSKKNTSSSHSYGVGKPSVVHSSTNSKESKSDMQRIGLGYLGEMPNSLENEKVKIPTADSSKSKLTNVNHDLSKSTSIVRDTVYDIQPAKFSLHSSPVLQERPSYKKSNIDFDLLCKNIIDIKSSLKKSWSLTFDPSVHTDVILMTNFNIFSDKIMPKRR